MKRKIKMIAGIVMVMVLICAFMVPFSASDNYGNNYTINYLYDTQKYRYDAWAWAYSDTTDFHAEVEVFLGATSYGNDYEHANLGQPMVFVSSQGNPEDTYAQADQYYHVWDCGPGY